MFVHSLFYEISATRLNIINYCLWTYVQSLCNAYFTRIKRQNFVRNKISFLLLANFQRDNISIKILYVMYLLFCINIEIIYVMLFCYYIYRGRISTHALARLFSFERISCISLVYVYSSSRTMLDTDS